MFDDPYPFVKVNVDTTALANPVKRVNYRFQAKNRKYFVTLEYFSFNIIAVKFRDNKDKTQSKATPVFLMITMLSGSLRPVYTSCTGFGKTILPLHLLSMQRPE